MHLYWVHTSRVVFIFIAHVVSWFALWRYADHAPWTILQALLLLCVPILLYLISHLAVPELEDERTHDMREYYFRQARWLQGLLSAVLATAVLAQVVIEAELDFAGVRGVRALMAMVLVPGVVSLNPRLHAVQAVLLMLIMAFAVSYVAQPIG